MKGRFLLPLLLCAAVGRILFAQAPVSHNARDEEKTPAGQYYEWAKQAVDEGRWDDARAALERASDYAGALSDISFLFAQVLDHEGENRRLILNALGRAIAAGRWIHYSETTARLMAAEHLVILRNYPGALAALADVDECADKAVLRLRALKGALVSAADTNDEIPAVQSAEFRSAMLEAMDRYPRDPRPVRIFFDYSSGRLPQNGDGDFNLSRDLGASDLFLMELALRRLPRLLETSPYLAWRAAPFIGNTQEAFRLVAAYRSGSLSRNARDFKPEPASIPVALNLGVISDEQAIEEFFEAPPAAEAGVSPNAAPVIDRRLLVSINGLLRDERGRELFARKLSSFSGSIIADDDADGYPESGALYVDGTVREYSADTDQDGSYDLFVSFSGGKPQWARVMPAPEADARSNSLALVHWENYPEVLRTDLDGTVYIPRPGDFRFAPLDFTELPGSRRYAGPLYPHIDSLAPDLSRRILAASSLQIQRPSAEFQGALEWTELSRGIPLRTIETRGGQVISVTEYEQGRPVLQRVDLDLDSRMETVRRFRAIESKGGDESYALFDYRAALELSESDRNGDGLYEYAELYRPDGSVVYQWDMDGDGVREYSETRNGNTGNGSEPN